MTLRAAVVGTNWGQVHVGALRAAGVQVVALCGTDPDRTRQVADEQGIDRVVTEVGHLLDPALSLDLVTVATPAATHGAVLAATAGLPAICEKPMIGLDGSPADLAGLNTDGIWVNYAYRYLPQARALSAALPELGPTSDVEVDAWYDMDLSFGPDRWVVELASHPLSGAAAMLGAPSAVGPASVDESWVRMDLAFGGTAGVLRCVHEPGLNGLRTRLRLNSDRGSASIVGEYRVGGAWSYQTEGLGWVDNPASDQGPGDPWIAANYASFADIVSTMTSGKGPQPGQFDVRSALALDSAVRTALGIEDPVEAD